MEIVRFLKNQRGSFNPVRLWVVILVSVWLTNFDWGEGLIGVTAAVFGYSLYSSAEMRGLALRSKNEWK